MRALLVCVVLGLLLAGCSTYHADDGGDPTRIDWDLSRSHTMDDVHWPRSEPVIDKADLRPVRSLRIRFPDGRRLTETVADPGHVLQPRGRPGHVVTSPSSAWIWASRSRSSASISASGRGGV